MPSIQLLNAEVDPGMEDSHFRILVDETSVRYLTIAGGLYDPDDLAFKPTFINIIPELPPGEWRQAHVALHPSKRIPYFESISYTDLPGVGDLWHPVKIDIFELKMGERLGCETWEATSDEISDQPFVIKWVALPWQIPWIEHETEIYSWIKGHSIGPEFLGYITEHGRVIGFMMEKISDARHAGPGDLNICREALKELHDIGIKKVDINRHNFLIRDGKAVLIDFDGATECTDSDELAHELDQVEAALNDTSGIGGDGSASSHD